MSYTVVIPARHGSTRLPGKPLLEIAGKTMVQRVWEQARLSSASEVVIATDDQRILDEAQRFGATVCMTSKDHPSGTDRLQEVASHFGWAEEQIVVNVQGDEPLVPPSIIDQVAENLQTNDQAGIATLSAPIERAEVFHDANSVKVVADCSGFALYFSRAPIPWPRDEMSEEANSLPQALVPQRHIGIYAYRVAFLHRFVTWPVAPLESAEKLEQLRAMTHGVKIHVAPAYEIPPAGVDTAEDLEQVRRLLGG